MKLNDYLKIRKFISNENLEEIMYYVNKLKEYEDNEQEVASIRVPYYIFDEFITAIKMLLEINYYEPSFINNIDFKTK